MHYYYHNIDDFNAATTHLTRVERSLYLDAIHLYYKLESPLDLDLKKLSRRLMARSQDELEALEIVLDEFFYLTDDGYKNDRCEEELAKYRETTNDKSIAGQISATTKKINKLKLSYTKKINDFKQEKDLTSAEQMINECLTAVQQVLNGCSTEVQQNFNTKGTESQLTKELNNLITKELSKKKKSKPKKETPPTAVFDHEKHFNEFWTAWPKRGDTRKTANDKFKTKCKTSDDFTEIMQGLNNFIPFYRTQDNKFIPSASTWLNQKRWMDEPPPIDNGKAPMQIKSTDYGEARGTL